MLQVVQPEWLEAPYPEILNVLSVLRVQKSKLTCLDHVEWLRNRCSCVEGVGVAL